MIPTYTRRYLSMHLSGSKYFLPFEKSLTAEEAFEKTIQLFSETPFYERELYDDHVKKPSVSHEQNEIQIKCLYEGYDEYYPFMLVVEFFRLDDEKKLHTGAYMVAIRMEHVYQGLLDELLEINTLPKLVSGLNLKEYSYLN